MNLTRDGVVRNRPPGHGSDDAVASTGTAGSGAAATTGTAGSDDAVASTGTAGSGAAATTGTAGSDDAVASTGTAGSGAAATTGTAGSDDAVASTGTAGSDAVATTVTDGGARTADRPAPARYAATARAGARLPGLLPALAGLAVLVAGLGARNPTLVLVAGVLLATSLTRRVLPSELALPAAALGLLLVSVTAGVLADLAGRDLLTAPALLSGGYLLVAVGLVGLAWRRPVVGGPRSAVSGWTWLAFGPAAVATATGLLQSRSTALARSWAFWGTDMEHHLALLREVQAAGALDYSASGYPRGLHLAAALASVPGAPLADPSRLLGYDLRLMAALSWLGLALLVWTGTATCLWLGARLGLPAAVAGAAGAVFGAGALLTNTFLESFVFTAAAPSLVAAAALWVLPLAVLARVPGASGWAGLLGVAAASTAALAHLWQALAVVPVVGVLAVLAPRAGAVLADLRRPARLRPAVPGLLVTAAAGALAVVPLLSVQRAGGASLAATPGGLGGAPWRLLLLGGLAALPVLARLGGPAARVLAGCAAGLLVTGAVLLRGAGSGLDLSQYYPTKAGWFLAVWLAPLLALLVTELAVRLGRSGGRLLARTGRPARVLRTSAVALAASVGVAFYLPWLLGTGAGLGAAWVPVRASDAATAGAARPGLMSAQRFDLALRYGAPGRDVVTVPYYVGTSAMFDTLSTRIVSELLSFQTGQPALAGDPANLCTALAQVAGDRPALVVSKLPARQVRAAMRRGGCPGRAGVRRVPGGITNPEAATTR